MASLLESSRRFYGAQFLESSHLFGQKYYGAPAHTAEKGTEMFWLIGVLVTLCGATLTVVGFMVQKTAHTASSQSANSLGRSGTPARPYYMEPRWLWGGLIWLVGNAICWVALGLTPQCVLAAMNCWNIIICLVIAPWFLGEAVTKHTAMSAGILAIGTAWVVANGPKVYQQHNVTLIVQALEKPQSICAFAMTAIFLGAMSVLAYNRWQRHVSQTLSYLQFTGVSATFAWYATLLSKSTAKVLVASVQLHQSLYLNPAFWALAAGFPICAVAQVHFLNMGLKYGDAVMVIPIYEALSMTGQIVVGGLVFDEFAGLTPHQHAWFWPGVAIVLIGIASLAMEAKSATAPNEKKIDEKVPLISIPTGKSLPNAVQTSNRLSKPCIPSVNYGARTSVVQRTGSLTPRGSADKPFSPRGSIRKETSFTPASPRLTPSPV